MSTRPDNAAQPHIRLASPQDVVAVHALIVEFAAATGHRHKISSSAEDFLKFGFSEQPAFHTLVAEQQGRVAGLCLFFYNFSSWRGELGVYVQDLVVAEDVRGTGLGRMLMACAASHGRRCGATHLRLSVDKSNQGAMDFYRGIGLSRCDDECIFQADGAAFARLAGIDPRE